MEGRTEREALQRLWHQMFPATQRAFQNTRPARVSLARDGNDWIRSPMAVVVTLPFPAKGR